MLRAVLDRYRRVIVAIAGRSLKFLMAIIYCPALYGCNVMQPTVRQCLVSFHPPTVICSRRMRAVQGTLQHWPGDSSYQITLTADTSRWGKRSLTVIDCLVKKTLILFTRGHWHCDHDLDQIMAWRHDHRSLKWSHELSPNYADITFFNFVCVL